MQPVRIDGTRSNQMAGVLLWIVASLFSWLTMMIVHEWGHILHAWISGGAVTKIVLHPLAISRTDVVPNPYPGFVVWGGPLWGCLLPLLALVIARLCRWRLTFLCSYWAGFCLIANGAYIGSGLWWPIGDARTMLQSGSPLWTLGLFGFVTIAWGLWLWNCLGRHFGFGADPEQVNTRDLLILCLVTILIAAIEWLLSA